MDTVLPIGDFKLEYKTQSDTILSCSVGATLNEAGQVVYVWEDGKGPVEGPNGEMELDPDNELCGLVFKRPVFASCKNNCPGGEF